MQTLDDYIDKAQHLVPAPVILSKLPPLLRQPNTDSTKVVELISYDQSLTGNVLRVCNSAYFGPSCHIDNLQYAVVRMGFRLIYDIVVSVIFSSTLRCAQEVNSAEANALWEHSIATAVAAQLIAGDLLADEQVVFTAAILHDIGKIVLAPALADLRDEVARETNKNGLTPLEIERKLLGVDHAQVGGRLLERWQLPEEMVAAVRHHHQPSAAEGYQQLTGCVNLGDFIAYSIGHGHGQHSFDLNERDESLSILNLSPEHASQYADQVLETLQEVKSLYQVQ
jgi:putative nucleotidyltransferase with HDIG domain